jgi:hypothetical protein
MKSRVFSSIVLVDGGDGDVFDRAGGRDRLAGERGAKLVGVVAHLEQTQGRADLVQRALAEVRARVGLQPLHRALVRIAGRLTRHMPIRPADLAEMDPALRLRRVHHQIPGLHVVHEAESLTGDVRHRTCLQVRHPRSHVCLESFAVLPERTQIP